MDIEADKRREVIGAINHFFDVWEEVSLSGADGNLRLDVVAVPRDRSIIDAAIGFEVKSPSRAPNFQNWAKAFKQAADYVDARIVDDRVPHKILTGVFVYPSPPYVPYVSPTPIMYPGAGVWFRNEQLLQYAGVIHLAQHFRVGHARWQKQRQEEAFQLSMGPNPVWNSKYGWARDGKNLLGSIRVGSTTKSRI